MLCDEFLKKEPTKKGQHRFVYNKGFLHQLTSSILKVDVLEAISVGRVFTCILAPLLLVRKPTKRLY